MLATVCHLEPLLFFPAAAHDRPSAEVPESEQRQLPKEQVSLVPTEEAFGQQVRTQLHSTFPVSPYGLASQKLVTQRAGKGARAVYGRVVWAPVSQHCEQDAEWALEVNGCWSHLPPVAVPVTDEL